jgi:hypothetical protein
MVGWWVPAARRHVMVFRGYFATECASTLLTSNFSCYRILELILQLSCLDISSIVSGSQYLGMVA